MIKIIEFAITEILIAEEACSKMISKACMRSPLTPHRVTGLCSNDEKVFVILEECLEDEKLPEYRFAPLSSLNEKDLTSEVSARFYSGFTTIASFRVEDRLWALFASRKTADK